MAITRGRVARPAKVVIYGPGGVGKTSLVVNAAAARLKPLVIDLEGGSHFFDTARVEVPDWDTLRGILRDPGLLDEFDLVAVDSLTKAEELASNWVLANITNDRGEHVQSIEGYGYGKGFTHIYEAFCRLLGDLDALVEAGKHVVGIAHDTTVTVTNPAGDDYVQSQPRLQSPAKIGQIRHKVIEWADHLLFVDFDRYVDKAGKARGGQTRTIFFSPQAHFWAKSRSCSGSLPYPPGDGTVWGHLTAKA